MKKTNTAVACVVVLLNSSFLAASPISPTDSSIDSTPSSSDTPILSLDPSDESPSSIPSQSNAPDLTRNASILTIARDPLKNAFHFLSAADLARTLSTSRTFEPIVSDSRRRLESVRLQPILFNSNSPNDALLSLGQINPTTGLTEYPPLKHLDTSRHTLSRSELRWIADTFPKLETLNLTYSANYPSQEEDILYILQRFQSLRSLNLSENGLMIRDVASAVDFKAALLRHPHLVELNLNANSIYPNGLTSIAESLAGLPQLRILKLNRKANSPVGSDTLTTTGTIGIIELANDLNQDAPNLEVLHLSNLMMGPNPINEIRTLIRLLPTSLVELDLSDNTEPDWSNYHVTPIKRRCRIQMNDLSNKLFELPNLRTLNFSKNALGHVGAWTLALHIKNSASQNYVIRSLPLTTLNLDGNYLGPEGAEEIATILQYMPNLQVLKLRNNSIQDRGARAIIAQMISLRMLKLRVDLTDNQISETTKRELFRRLKEFHNSEAAQ